MTTVISVENLSKQYRLGVIGGATLREDLHRWWAKKRGKPDPYLKIGQTDHGNREGERIWALRDVSFEVKEGEILGIIGRNGAGKSTLLKILSRITAPTSGCIKVKGRVASLLEVGTGFHPELTGRENIYLNGAILGMTKAEITRKLDEIIDFSEIEDYIDTPVKRYSSGMTVRLAFAVAAHLEPEILVVDEVLAVGDAAFQKKCLGKMEDVSRGGRTVLFVSHNMLSVKSLCTRLILLNAGTVSLVGEPESVVEDYLNTVSQNKDTVSHVIFDPKDSLNNEYIKLFKIGAGKTLAEYTSEFYLEDDIFLSMTYSISSIYNKTIALHFWVFDKYENCIFITVDRPAKHKSHLISPGIYSVSCKIPGHLLNEGDYYIDVIITNPEVRQKHIIIKKGLHIRLTERNRDSAYYDKIPGYIRPNLSWTAKNIEPCTSYFMI